MGDNDNFKTVFCLVLENDSQNVNIFCSFDN